MKLKLGELMKLKQGTCPIVLGFILLFFGVFSSSLSFAQVCVSASIQPPSAQSPAPDDPSKPLFLAPQNQKWVTPPANFPAGVQLMVLDGDPSLPKPFIMRLKLPANHEIRAHWHPADERVAVISGHIMMGLGDKLDKQKEAHSLPAGSYFRIPAKTHHYGWTTEETVLQLTGHGPWRVNFLNTEGKAK